MEEWVMPEEERGVYEPYTIKNDIAEMTYQYNEGVKPITENVMKYFAGVESDTILYFTDNVPKEWMPEKGGYIAMGCNSEFPLGFSGRVVDMSHSNGAYRLVITSATEDEIFKVLKYTVDTDILLQDIPEDWDVEDFAPTDGDSTSLSRLRCRPISRAGMYDKTYIDYSDVQDECPELYEWQMKKHFPSRYSRSDDDYKDAPEDTEESFTVSAKLKNNGDISAKYVGNSNGNERSFELPTANIANLAAVIKKNQGKIDDLKAKLEAEKNKKVNASLYVEVLFKNTKTTHFHAQRTDDKNKEQWKTQKNEDEFSVTFGIEVEGKGVIKDFNRDVDYQKEYEEYVKKQQAKDDWVAEQYWNLAQFQSWSPKFKEDFEKMIERDNTKLVALPKWKVLIGTTGLTLKIEGECGFKFSAVGIGTFKVKSKTWSKTGNIEENGDKKAIQDGGPIINGVQISNKDKDKKGAYDTTFNYEGSIKGGVYGEVQVLVSYMETFSVGAKANVGVGFELQTGNANNIPLTSCPYAPNDKYIKPYFEVKIDIVAEVTALGLPIFSKEFNIVEHDFFKDVKWKFDPSFSSSMKSLDADFVDTEEGALAKVNYTFSDLGLSPFNKNYEPRVLVYKRTIDQREVFEWENELNCCRFTPLAELKATNATTRLQAGKKYLFEGIIKGADQKGQYIFIPVLYYPSSGNYLYYADKAVVRETGQPKIEIIERQQTLGHVITEAEAEKLGVKYKPNRVLYQFAVFPRIRNAAKIRTVEWDISIYDIDGNKLHSETIKDTRAFTSKLYCNVFTFIMTPPSKSDVLDVNINIALKDKNGNYNTDFPHTRLLLYGELKDELNVDNFDMELIKKTCNPSSTN